MNEPSVSIAIPVLDEAAWIEETLAAVRNQRDGTPEIEILVVDGGSSDDTLAILKRLAEADPRISVLDNPQRFQAAALNLALGRARGEFFLRVDARSRISEDYVARCVELLEAGRAENVGGRMVPRGTTPMGEAIALATSTPFGMGNSHFHYATEEREVDTVYLGAWRCQTLRDLGGFDERAHANEDYELNVRLREAGGRILLSPEIRSIYVPRSDWPGLRRQYSRYGRWKAWTLWKHPTSLRLRQVVPPAFVLSLALAAALAPWSALAATGLGLLVGSYGAAVLAAACRTALPAHPRHLARLLLIFPTIHLCWGIGLWSELARLASSRRPPPERCPACAR